MIGRNLGLAVSVLACVVTGASAADKKMPEEMAKFVDRVQMCLHWAGEEGYDAARSEEISKAQRDLKCDALSPEAKRLQKKYSANPGAMKALKSAVAEWKQGMAEDLLK